MGTLAIGMIHEGEGFLPSALQPPAFRASRTSTNRLYREDVANWLSEIQLKDLLIEIHITVHICMCQTLEVNEITSVCSNFAFLIFVSSGSTISKTGSNLNWFGKF